MLDPDLQDFTVPVREVRASVGAGFLYPLLGAVRATRRAGGLHVTVTVTTFRRSHRCRPSLACPRAPPSTTSTLTSRRARSLASCEQEGESEDRGTRLALVKSTWLLYRVRSLRAQASVYCH